MIFEFLLCGLDTLLIYFLFHLTSNLKQNVYVQALSSMIITYISFMITSNVNSATYIMVAIAVITYSIYSCFLFKISIQNAILYNLMFQIMNGIITVIILDISLEYFRVSVENLMFFGFTRLVFVLLIKLILMVLIVRLSNALKNIKNNLPSEYFWGYLILLNVSLVTIVELHNNLDQFESFALFAILILIIIVGEYILLIRLAQMLQQKNIESMLELSNRMMEKQLQLIQQDDIETKKLKHDMKNHLFNIQYMITNFDTKNSQNLINEINQKLLETTVKISTGNICSDMVFNCMIHKFPEIEFKIDCQIRNEVGVKSIDFSSLLANLVENAAEAAMQTKTKIVEITLKETQSNYFILIKNQSISNPIKQDFRSLKMEGFHGYGMQIIRDIVTRYEGDIFTEFDNNLFTIQIIIEKIYDSNKKITTKTKTM